MATARKIGVLVKDGHSAWPPRLAGRAAERADLIAAPTAAALAAKASSVDALVWVPGVAAAEVAAAHASLQPDWVHSFPAGVDGLRGFLDSAEFAGRKVPTTNGRGAFSSSLAEYALMAILHFTKQVPRCAANAEAKKWDPFVMDVVAGKTVGFVGYGHIAKATARLCRAFGMRVVACRRSASAGGEDAPDATYSIAEKLKLFRESDYVVCSLPGTAETDGFCGAPEFDAMKASAVFVSLGRGAAVDEAALASTLAGGGIRGAALDVFRAEPLPEASPLWGLGDKVLLTAHNADLTDDYFDLGWRVFADNFDAWAAGAAWATPFDPAQGY